MNANNKRRRDEYQIDCDKKIVPKEFKEISGVLRVRNEENKASRNRQME